MGVWVVLLLEIKDCRCTHKNGVLCTQVDAAQHLMRECGLSPGHMDKQGRNALMHAAAADAEQVGVCVCTWTSRGGTRSRMRLMLMQSRWVWMCSCMPDRMGK